MSRDTRQYLRPTQKCFVIENNFSRGEKRILRAEKGGRNHTEILNAWKLKKVGGIEVFCSVRKSGREEFVNV